MADFQVSLGEKQSRRRLFLLVFSLLFHPSAVLGQNQVEVITDEVRIDFPDNINFHLVLNASEEIISAELAYGTDSLTCQEITSITNLELTPESHLDLSWRWSVSDGTVIPPGGHLWWQWSLTTTGGEVITLPRQSSEFIDRWFVWRSSSMDNLSVSWYRGDMEFAEQILVDGVTTLEQLAEDTDMRIDEAIHVYLYEEPFDMQISIPGLPAWSGGVAFPAFNTVLVVASPNYLDESIRTLRHELGHLVFDKLTSNCTSATVSWLSEGLAMMAEMEEDQQLVGILEEAISENEILTLSQIEGSFSVHSDKALLAYAQSDSLVRFLIETFGKEGLSDLLEQLRDGASTGAALLSAIQLSESELEAAWRRSIGAQPAKQNTSSEGERPSAIPTFALVNPQPTKNLSLANPTATQETPEMEPSKAELSVLELPTEATPNVKPTDMMERPTALSESGVSEADASGKNVPTLLIIPPVIILILGITIALILYKRTARKRSDESFTE